MLDRRKGSRTSNSWTSIFLLRIYVVIICLLVISAYCLYRATRYQRVEIQIRNVNNEKSSHLKSFTEIKSDYGKQSENELRHNRFDITASKIIGATEEKSPTKKYDNCRVVQIEKGCELQCDSLDSPTKIVTSVGYAGTKFQHQKPKETYDHGRFINVPGKGWEDGCVISHKYKFIYIHVLKSGGTAIKIFLKKGLCGVETVNETCPDEDNIFSVKESCASALKKHPKYFTWSFVRNPYSRMFSGYAMAKGMRKESFVTFVSFDEFVTAKKDRHKFSRLANTHFWPQNHWLLDRKECPYFDFIGRLENLEEDMKYVLEQINSSELNLMFKANGNTVVRTNAWGLDLNEKKFGGDSELVYQNPIVLKKVASEYKNDFRLLGYNANVPPETTKSN